MPVKECRYGFVFRGKRKTYNRKHLCSRFCGMDGADVLAYLRDRDEREGVVQVEHPPCACGKPYAAHFAPCDGTCGKWECERARGEAGLLFSHFRAITCGHGGYSGGALRHLLTCDCLDCVTSRLTADRKPAA